MCRRFDSIEEKLRRFDKVETALLRFDQRFAALEDRLTASDSSVMLGNPSSPTLSAKAGTAPPEAATQTPTLRPALSNKPDKAAASQKRVTATSSSSNPSDACSTEKEARQNQVVMRSASETVATKRSVDERKAAILAQVDVKLEHEKRERQRAAAEPGTLAKAALGNASPLGQSGGPSPLRMPTDGNMRPRLSSMRTAVRRQPVRTVTSDFVSFTAAQAAAASDLLVEAEMALSP